MTFKLSEEFVQVVDHVASWQESIRLAAQPLVDYGFIGEKYIDEMIETAIELNFYIVIMPFVAMPHARNNGSVYKNGFSILRLRNPVGYEDEPVKLVIPLACVDNESHMEMLMSIAEVLGDELNLKILLDEVDTKRIVKLFRGEE